MAEKPTKMLIKVDLQCCRCYMKIKKILCKFPQIRDQIYDEKQNTVTITVVCCSPEKILQNIQCEGGQTVESIKILPPPPLLSQPPPPQPCCYDGCGRLASQCQRGGNRGMCNDGCRKSAYRCRGGDKRGRCYDGCGRPAYQCQGGGKRDMCFAVHGRTACQRGRMCNDGCGRPAYQCQGGCNRAMCYDGCGRPAYECRGGRNTASHVYMSRCDYLSDENPNACSIT